MDTGETGRIHRPIRNMLYYPGLQWLDGRPEEAVTAAKTCTLVAQAVNFHLT